MIPELADTLISRLEDTYGAINCLSMFTGLETLSRLGSTVIWHPVDDRHYTAYSIGGTRWSISILVTVDLLSSESIQLHTQYDLMSCDDVSMMLEYGDESVHIINKTDDLSMYFDDVIEPLIQKGLLCENLQ